MKKQKINTVLATARKALYGKGSEIAQRAQVSIATVYNVFNGRSSNEQVLQVIEEMLREAKDVAMPRIEAIEAALAELA